jgi:hypothetical protein
VALELGWTEPEITSQAAEARSVFGVRSSAGPFMAHRHEVTILVSLGRSFAALSLPVFFTPPNELVVPVLGRRDFLRRVDFALIEAEQRFLLRFRDSSAVHASW